MYYDTEWWYYTGMAHNQLIKIKHSCVKYCSNLLLYFNPKVGALVHSQGTLSKEPFELHLTYLNPSCGRGVLP
jgi:hypothetical protein